MSKINMRSVKRDLQVMSLGLGAIQREINILEDRKSKDKSTKKRVLTKMLKHYESVEDYEKCKHVQQLMDMLERTNENSSKKS